MAVTKPEVFTPIEDIEVSLNRPSQEELIRKFFQNLNMLGELAVIGAVEAFQVNQPGVETPEPTVFQLADGSEITESTSPLKSDGFTTRNTPDTRNRYIRAATAGTTLGTELGGAATVDLHHSHGPTGDATSALVGDSGDKGYSLTHFHFHLITNDLGSATPLNPAFLYVAWYLKIN